MNLRAFLGIVCLIALMPAFASGGESAPEPRDGGCADCPVSSAKGDACKEECLLCVCGTHRLPMMTEAAPAPTPAAEIAPYDFTRDTAHADPAPHDILHVPIPLQA